MKHRYGSVRLTPAFRHNQTGTVVLSSPVHDLRNLPGMEDVAEDDLDHIDIAWLWTDGFVDGNGHFYTRDEAMNRFGAGETRTLARRGLIDDSK